MADMTREEVDAKIATSDARCEALMASFRETLAAFNARLDHFEAAMRQEMQEFKHDVGIMIADLKKTVIITCISATLATVLGVAAFNAALLSNMRASYDSGKEAGEWRRDMALQNEENRKWRLDMEKQIAENQQWRLDMERQNQENRKMLDKLEKQSVKTQQMLGDIKQERASGRR